MSELKMISPLLDNMTVEKQGPSFDGRTYYTLRDRSTGEQLMLKVLSIPSSDSHVRALILSGAYPDEAAVNEYYRRYTEDIRRELKLGKELTDAGFFAGALNFQVVPREEVGFDIYILLKRHVPLSYLLNENAITGLRAVNLGIDICDALISCREAGLLFTNLTPESIYLTPGDKFLLGGLGLIPLDELSFSSVPEEYIGAYSAPELSDINEYPNTTIDIYSLGMVLFRIYNGNHGPYEDENTGEKMADKLRLSGKPLPTPIYADYELAGIIQKACAFQKEDRFQTPEELKQALVLYMQRNQVSDRLIVPPIVVNFTPPVDLPEEDEDEDAAPVRMTKEDTLDDAFRQSFAPDLSGAGAETVAQAEATAAVVDTATAEKASECKQDTAPAAQEETPPQAKKASAPKKRSGKKSGAPAADEAVDDQLVLPTAAGYQAPVVGEISDALANALASSTEDAEEVTQDDDTAFFAELTSYTPGAEDPDQIDIDSLLASISEVIGDSTEDEEEVVAADDVSEAAEDLSEEADSDFAEEEALEEGDAAAAEEPEAEDEPTEDTSGSEEDNSTEDKSEDGLRLRFEKPTVTRRDYMDVREGAEKASAAHSEQKKAKILPVLILLTLVLAIGLVAFFLVRWYFIEASALNVTSLSTDELVVQLISADPADSFSITCTDSHGNSYLGARVADQYRFTGLSESTTYTLNVEAKGFHKLSDDSVQSHSVTTPDGTHITEFSASRGDADGSVLLAFYHEGPTPEDWILSYSNPSGSVADSITFDGNAYIVNDLPVGETYTFTLEQTEGIFIKDSYTVSYELLPIVIASELTVDSISANSLSISWASTANQPEKWDILCEAEGMDPISLSAQEPTCEIPVTDFSREYTITVSARGMDDPIRIVLPANPIVVEGFSVIVDEDGNATVSWQTPVGTPAGGWYLSYNTIGSLHPDYILGGENTPIENNTVQISHLIPGAEYRFALSLTESDISRPVFGLTELVYVTDEAKALNEFGISPNAPIDSSENFITLYPLPNYSSWNYTDLRNRSTEYDSDDKVAVCVELLFQPFSSEEVHLCYAVRNAEGQVVNDVSDTVVWDDMWYRRRHASAIPMPTGEDGSNLPGEYKLEIYVNGKIFAYIEFTIA